MVSALLETPRVLEVQVLILPWPQIWWVVLGCSFSISQALQVM